MFRKNLTGQFRNTTQNLRILTCLSAAILLSATGHAQQSALAAEGLDVIPYPQTVHLAEDSYDLPKQINIITDRNADKADLFTAGLLQEELREKW